MPNPQKESDEEEFSSSVDDDEDLYIDGNNNLMINFDPNPTNESSAQL